MLHIKTANSLQVNIGNFSALRSIRCVPLVYRDFALLMPMSRCLTLTNGKTAVTLVSFSLRHLLTSTHSLMLVRTVPFALLTAQTTTCCLVGLALSFLIEAQNKSVLITSCIVSISMSSLNLLPSILRLVYMIALVIISL